MIKFKFVGIDGWNRPVFRGGDNNRIFIGSVDKLFPMNATEIEVKMEITKEDLCYFGSKFNCEPMGTNISPDKFEIEWSE